MKFRFEDQPHQAAAIASVTDLFEGALTPPIDGAVGQAPGAAGHAVPTRPRGSRRINSRRSPSARTASSRRSKLVLLAVR